METDPDPTQPNRGCEFQACPCRALARSADAWGVAAAFVRELDNEPDEPDEPKVIRLPKQRRR
jgi:hypothetical protein